VAAKHRPHVQGVPKPTNSTVALHLCRASENGCSSSYSHHRGTFCNCSAVQKNPSAQNRPVDDMSPPTSVLVTPASCHRCHTAIPEIKRIPLRRQLRPTLQQLASKANPRGQQVAPHLPVSCTPGKEAHQLPASHAVEEDLCPG